MRGIDARPGSNNWQDLGGGHVGQGNVVPGREGQDVATARHRLCLEKKRGKVIVFDLGYVGLLLFLDCAVVVYENEGVFVLRVAVALGTLVARAEVAFRVILGELVLRGPFLLTSTQV